MNKKLLLLFAMPFFIGDLRAQVCFNPITNYAVGSYACTLATNDFNNDGLPDIATANHWGNTSSILINMGAGTFTWSANPLVDTEPLWITTGDYNKDGNADLATANESAHSISILLGNGNGTFAPAVNYANRGEGSSIASGDFNGDSNIDLAVTTAHYDSVGIFLGDGTGSFTISAYYDTGALGEPDQVDTGDVNEDGIVDLVVGNWAGSIAILIGNGAGGFSAPTIYNTTGIKPTCGILRDFDNDGHLDLAACNYFSNNVSIFKGNGTGTFATAVNFPIGGIKPYTLWSDDFDGDGNLDIVTPNEGSNNVTIILGDGAGNFGAPAIFAAAVNTEQAITADFDGNGRMDIAAVNFGNNKMTVLLNAPPPTVTASASADTICAGNQVTLYGGGTTTYAWSNGVTNATAFSPTVTATYTVTGTDSLGCTNWDSITVQVNICTEVITNKDLHFGVYPNPAQSNFKIDCKNLDVRSVQLFDATGKLIWQRILPAEMLFEINDLKAGMYNVVVTTSQKVLTQKLAVIK